MADIKVYGRMTCASGDRLANASELRDDGMKTAMGASQSPTQAEINKFLSTLDEDAVRFKGKLNVVSSAVMTTIKAGCPNDGDVAMWICANAAGNTSGGYAVCSSALATALHSGDSRGVAVNLGDLLVAVNLGGGVTVKCLPLNDAKKPADAGGVGTYGLMVPNDKEKLDAAVDAIDKTCFRCYSGEYNMNYCGWYGYYMYGTLGRPAGSADGEFYVLRVADGGQDGDYIVLEQTAYSCKDASRVFRRIVRTKDRNDMATDGNTEWGDWVRMATAADLDNVSVAVDDTFSDSSANPVQNKAITQALNGKQDRLTEGEGITISDDNVISAKVTATVEVDEELSSESENPVQNKAIKAKLDSMDTSIGDNADDIKTLWAKVFPLTLTVTGGGVYEKGTSQTVTVNWNVKEGDTATFPDTVTVNDTSVLATVQSKQFSSVTTDTTYTVAITKGGVSKTGSVKAQFVNPSYFGVVDSDFEATEEGIKALGTKSVKAVKAYNTDAFSQSAQRNCYTYPKSFGALASVTDGKNEFIGSYTMSEVTVNGETYYVYLLTDPSTVTDYKLQFK